ncbi:MAG: hypothetical protein ABIJ56_06810 [Pseudomonadota bacterium]
MNKRLSSLMYGFIVIALIMFTGVCAEAQDVANGTPDLMARTPANSSLGDLGRLSEDFIDAAGTVLGHEATQTGMHEGAKRLDINAEKFEKLKKIYRATGQDQAEKAAGELSKEAAGDAVFFRKLKKFFQAVNVAGGVSRVAGHLSVGDKTGAAYSLLDELLKNGAAAAGAMIGAPIPFLGPVMGALAGEELHKKYGSKFLENRVQDILDEEARQKYSVPYLPQETFISQGRTRVLEPDQYYDWKTGLVGRRTPAEQRKYEEYYRQQYRERATSTHPLDVAYRDYKNGTISYKDLLKKVNGYGASEEKKKYEAALAAKLFNTLYGGSYKGRFSGKATGSIKFTLKDNKISGSISGVFKGDPISGSFSGKVGNDGKFSTAVSGTFTGPPNMDNRTVPFTGTVSGGVIGSTGSGNWSAKSGGSWKITATGSWNAPKL